MEIIICDLQSSRLTKIENNLRLAMKQLGIEGVIRTKSEMPVLGRLGLIGKTPVLDIKGYFWSLPKDVEMDLEQCLDLLRRLNNIDEKQVHGDR